MPCSMCTVKVPFVLVLNYLDEPVSVHCVDLTWLEKCSNVQKFFHVDGQLNFVLFFPRIVFLRSRTRFDRCYQCMCFRDSLLLLAVDRNTHALDEVYTDKLR